MKKKKVNGRYKSKIVKNQMKKKKKVTFSNGEVGYRSPYLSHAKRALYHLSYIPVVIFGCAILYQTLHSKVSKSRKGQKQESHRTFLQIKNNGSIKNAYCIDYKTKNFKNKNNNNKKKK